MIATNDHAALVMAIRQNPDDDTTRLVYADWCDENDQPFRAEFIRAQIDGDERKAIAMAVPDIHKITGWRWLSIQPEMFPSRGFYRECRADYTTISDFGDILFSEYPILVVNFTHPLGDHLRKFEERWPGIKFKCPELRNYLEISGNASDRAFTGATVGLGSYRSGYSTALMGTHGITYNPMNYFASIRTNGSSTIVFRGDAGGNIGTSNYQPNTYIPTIGTSGDLPFAEDIDE